MASILLLVAAALAGQTSAARRLPDVDRLDLSAPVILVSVDAGQAPGYPVRLAWSLDGRSLYLQLVKRDRWGNERVWHFEVELPGRQFRPLEREPAWVARYWAWKSALAVPGDIGFAISLETRVERKTATGSGAGGAIG